MVSLNVAVSGTETPPKRAQLFPAKGCPDPTPQVATLQSGVPKFVEVCVVHADHGGPASNVPSTTPSKGVQVGDGVPAGVLVGVFVGVDVQAHVGVAVGVRVGVFVDVADGVLVGVGVVDPGIIA